MINIPSLSMAGSPLLLSASTSFCRMSWTVIVQRPMVITPLPTSSFLLPPFSRRSPSRKVPVVHAHIQSRVVTHVTLIASLPGSRCSLPLSPCARQQTAACWQCTSEDLPEVGGSDVPSGVASRDLAHPAGLAQCRSLKHACSSPVGAQVHVSEFCCLSVDCLSHWLQQLGFSDPEDCPLVLSPSVSFSHLAASFNSPYPGASLQLCTSIIGLSHHLVFRGTLCQIFPGEVLDTMNVPAHEEDGRLQRGARKGLTVCGAEVHNEWLLFGIEGDAGMHP